jgi:HD-like signal output (HDOD) protein
MGSNEHISIKRLYGIKEIPTLPDSVITVLDQSRNSDIHARNLTEILSKDQKLASRVLDLCNSAYYGLPRVVSSLSQAVVYLGFYTIRSLILTCAIGRLLNTESKIYGFKDTGLWFHTVACAIVSEIISKKTHPDICTAAFTAGLLHDVGHLVIGTQLPEKTDTIEDFMVNEGVSLIQAERETLGFSHDEAGALLAEFWRFPDELRDAIRYHHSPMESPQPSALTSIVHLADSLVLDLGYGIELEQLKYEPQDCALQMLSLSQEELENLRQHAEERVREHAPVFIEITQA